MGIVITIDGMTNFLLMITDEEVHISITTLSNHHNASQFLGSNT
jgi:hypothetical protein